MRLMVALKIPEVDDMLERTQEKVNQIRKAKEAAGGIKPIDEVIFAQNVPQYNPEWEYRSGTVNSNMVNSKFHLIRSCCEYLARFLSFHV